MRRTIVCVSFFLIITSFIGCSGVRLTEEEYVAKAEEMLSQGNIEDAIFSYESLIKYYPESEKINDYNSKLLELKLEAADKFADTKKGQTYMAEALAFAEEKADTLKNWIKYRMAVMLESSDPENANVIFAEITPQGYNEAAQIYLQKEKVKESIAVYEKMLEVYPDREDNFKAIFMIGFNYSEYLQDYDKAGTYFQRVIDDYPDCELVKSAEWMLENMGKPPEEIKFIDEDEEKEPEA
ncbi:hypothetical protein DRQ36_04405 [bacterium]|nr:MAG: hypothetical protein DRQ36_04405 [bacterium]